MSEGLPLMGFGLPVSGSWATPATMQRVAHLAEELGWASLWTFQRLLSPVVRDGAGDAPGARAADDPAYLSVHDALLPLAYVAAHTSRIGLGTATVCAPFTVPVVLAKAFTTLDHLSRGRLTVGVGMGWMPEEHAAADVPFERRGPRFEDYLRCLDALWTQDPVAYDGEFYRVPLSHPGFRPVQQPRPPLLVGGAAPAALRRAGRLADGWICSSNRGLEEIAQSVELVREGARDAGRDPAGLRVLARVVPDLAGDIGQVAAHIAALGTVGVTEVVVDLNFSPDVGSPYVDAARATAEAERVLHALAPRPMVDGDEVRQSGRRDQA